MGSVLCLLVGVENFIPASLSIEWFDGVAAGFFAIDFFILTTRDVGFDFNVACDSAVHVP